jgi:hypothetical protein
MRSQAYRSAIESIAETITTSPDRAAIGTCDIDVAARFWLEGLLGHARLATSEGRWSAQQAERWADDYTRFYFAGLQALSQTG